MLSVRAQLLKFALESKNNTKVVDVTTASIIRANNSADCAMSAQKLTKNREIVSNGCIVPSSHSFSY